jgi:hypothetical protein
MSQDRVRHRLHVVGDDEIAPRDRGMRAGGGEQ